MIKRLRNDALCQLCNSKFYIDNKKNDFACSNPDCKMAKGYNEYIKELKQIEKNRREEYRKILGSLKFMKRIIKK